MEQVPHWLQATVFAAGMTAYAEEVDAGWARGVAAEGPAETAETAVFLPPEPLP